MKVLKANTEVAEIYVKALEKLLPQIEGRDVKRAFKAITPESTYPCGFIYSKTNECIYVQLDSQERSRLREIYGKEGEDAISRAIGTIHFGNDTPEVAIGKTLEDYRSASETWRELSEPAQAGRIAAKHDEALAILLEIDMLELPQSVRYNGWILPIFAS
jgi:hypothetical protein